MTAVPGRPAANERTERRPRVVHISYSCVPGEGSEGGVGWMWAVAASSFADVTVLTAPSSKRVLVEAGVASSGLPLRIEWVRLPTFLEPLLPGKVLGMIRYGAWQVLAGLRLRQIERSGAVDVVHHVTWASDSLPSALLFSRAPVRIWGPVGGTTRTPLGLYRYLTVRGWLGEVFRDVMNGLLRRTTGRWCARHATSSFALNRDVVRWWATKGTQMHVESNTALQITELPAPKPPEIRRQGQRTALFAGRLIPWKGLLLAVQCLRYAPSWRLVVYGAGADATRALARAERLGVADRLELRGVVPRPELLENFATADALLMPSFHDSAGWAAGEAGAIGCPVVCLDAGGVAIQAGPNAHVVPIVPARSLAARLGAELESLPVRKQPSQHLFADRLPAILVRWYGLGQTSVTDPLAQASTVSG